MTTDLATLRVMRSVVRAVLSGVAGLALAAAAVTSPAAAASPLEYDALGDSYASGYGVPPYSATCGRSQSAYAVRLDRLKKIDLDDFVACAGATTTTLVSGGQLAALDTDTDLVTISIGGNDVRWGDAVGACLGGTDAQCTTALATARAAVTNALPGLLDSVYAQISSSAPNAHVVVTGYPRLFSPKHGVYFNASVAEQKALNNGADLLNKTIAKAAKRHGFQFVSVTKRFRDHGANAAKPWILGVMSPGRFHPSAKGYRAYTSAITAAVKAARLK